MRRKHILVPKTHGAERLGAPISPAHTSLQLIVITTMMRWPVRRQIHLVFVIFQILEKPRTRATGKTNHASTQQPEIRSQCFHLSFERIPCIA
jgi:hypothetical protein